MVRLTGDVFLFLLLFHGRAFDRIWQAFRVLLLLICIAIGASRHTAFCSSLSSSRDDDLQLSVS